MFRSERIAKKKRNQRKLELSKSALVSLRTLGIRNVRESKLERGFNCSELSQVPLTTYSGEHKTFWCEIRSEIIKAE